jgi:hypothetical protein
MARTTAKGIPRQYQRLKIRHRVTETVVAEHFPSPERVHRFCFRTLPTSRKRFLQENALRAGTKAEQFVPVQYRSQ